MTILQEIHNLEQEIIQLKTTQPLGSSSSKIMGAWSFSQSGTAITDLNFVLVFTAQQTIHPLIRTEANVIISGVTASDRFENGVFSGGKMCYITNDTTRILGSLYANGQVSSDIFNEHTTAVLYNLSDWDTDGTSSWSYSINGTLYSTCLGTIRTFVYEV